MEKVITAIKMPLNSRKKGAVINVYGMEAAENLVWNDPEMAADLLVYLTKGN